jgi:hypothetical protein
MSRAAMAALVIAVLIVGFALAQLAYRGGMWMGAN